MGVRILFMLAVATAFTLHVQAADEVAAKPGAAEAEAAIYRRIDRLRRAADRLRIDGMDRDWAEFPQMTDPRGDADARRDLVAAAIAPTDTDLWIMLRTAGAPSTDPWVYAISVDLWGERGSNFRIEMESLDHPLVLRMLDERGQPGKPLRLPHARLAVRRVVEMRIPLHDIAMVVPKEIAPLISGDRARPWIRIEVNTWDGQKQRIVDRGPSAASFRLLPTPCRLDPPLPERPRPPVPLDLPVRGQWYVLQGPFSTFTHQGIWAYDLTMLDSTGQAAQLADSKRNEDYFAWKQPVHCPIDGRVSRVRADVEDGAPLGVIGPPQKNPANEVFVSSGQGYGVNLVHLLQGSPAVAVGARVTAGQRIAAVGNSGASDSPHLHLAVWASWPAVTLPAALRNVRVGLNPVADDPWARDLPTWEPRRGYFVEAAAGR